MMFNETSYKIQRECFQTHSEEEKKVQKSWFDEKTVDNWRHARMYAPFTPLLRSFPGTRWLTVGDGRFGLDSVRLKRIEPSLKILPTDLSPYLLEEAKKNAIIEEYKVENAEFLSFEDGEFDFAFCKESYHHFPRPYLSVYEMLRVSRRGIIFVEPNEQFPRTGLRRLLDHTVNIFRRFTGRKIPHRDEVMYEEAGNYVYALSKREVEKIALGLQLPAVAIRYFNDVYEEGVEFENVSDSSKLFSRIKRKLAWKELLVNLRLTSPSYIMACIFKELPDAETLALLRREKFEINLLPGNPYLAQKK